MLWYNSNANWPNMKVLIVASYNKQRFAPFVIEQAEALQQAGCTVEWFGVQGKGLCGYLRELPRLRKAIHTCQPDVIHAHYGLSGLLANLATRQIPVVTTYHGSDINNSSVRIFSQTSMRASAWNIFVSRKLMTLARCSSRCSVIPCGVTLTEQQWQCPKTKKVLFAGAFDNEVKDAPLAHAAMKYIQVELIELKGYTRQEVTHLLCTSSCLLLTSKNEGSPQIIKEALACGCPIVSVDVGDVKERMDGVDGCYIVPTRDPKDIAAALQQALAITQRTKGREKIMADGLTNEQVAKKIMDLYACVEQGER